MKTAIFLQAFLCLTAIAVSAQQLPLKGQVLDETDKSPIAFVNVQLLRSDSTFLAGAVSDDRGYFKLELEGIRCEEAGQLSLSCIGYRTLYVSLLDEVRADTLRLSLRPLPEQLSEVVVNASQIVVKDDRRLIFPTTLQAEVATDGLDLLRKMHLPHLSVNPLTGEVRTTVVGDVRLCVNGVQVTSAELAAISPRDILRIEYHDSPGARYGDAAVVIDYVTCRRETGGGVNGDFMNTFGNGHCGVNHFAMKQNYRKSEWTFNVRNFQVQRNEWVRNYSEQRMLSGGTIRRQEVGLPVPVNLWMVGGNLGYSLMEKDKYLLSVQLNYAFCNTPQSEESDRRNTVFSSDTNDSEPFSIYEHMEESSHSPVFDFYFQHTLGNGSQLMVDVVGTYIRTHNSRVYQECLKSVPVTDIFSRIEGNKYSVIAEGVYEKTFGGNKLTAGMKHLQAYTVNEYTGTAVANVAMRQSESSFYAEYGYRADWWGYMVNLTATRFYYSQNDGRTQKYALQPSARISFEPDNRFSLRYRVDLRTVAPSLSIVSGVEQRIDAGQVRRGNPQLRAFHTLDQSLMAGYNRKIIGIDLLVSYKHEYRPIMESVFLENDLIVRTYCNQRSFRTLSVAAALKFCPWREHLTVSVGPEVYRYVSRGYSYLHTYTLPKLGVDVDFSYGKWLFSYNTMRGYANFVYGEQLMKEKDMHCMFVGFRQPDWTLMVGALNPLSERYWMEIRGWSEVNPSVSKAYTDKPAAFMVKLTFNLNYGRQKQGKTKQINNEDTDSGIMKSIKE